MTPRQRVMDALNFKPTPRVPFSWGFGPTAEQTRVLEKQLAHDGVDWATLRRLTDDVWSTGPAYIGPPLPPETDIWGLKRSAVSYGGGEYDEVTDPPLAGVTDPAELADYPWPDPDWFDWDGLADKIDAELAEAGDKAVRVSAGNALEHYMWLTGMEEAMVNLLTEPDLVAEALERIGDYFQARLERMLAAAGDRIHLLFFADDLGSQNGPLLSPALYESVIQPTHRRLLATAERLAPHACRLFHSDGSVFALLDALLDAGVQCLEAVQVECADMAPEKLKAAYAGRLAFHGAISVQQLLPRAEATTVAESCRELVALMSEGGGYLAAPSHAVQVGTPVENVLAMLRAVLGEDDFELAWEAAKL